MPRLTGVTVVGGGLAGCEAALVLACRGRAVQLVEMRPVRGTPAHQTGGLGELVCANSFKSEHPTTAHGQLKREMRHLGSALLAAAEESRVPAGSALAVDRGLFSRALTRRVVAHPGIMVVREEALSLPGGPAVVATGPLTSPGLAAGITAELGGSGLAFYDAIAPIVHADSVDRQVAFAAGRYQQEADYLNCPLDEAEYDAFMSALRHADVYEGHDWEKVPYFEGCLGVEGYTESAASGILAGINLDRVLDDWEPVIPPPQTMLGGLCRYLQEADATAFQPMNSNWGLVDPLPGAPRKKAARREALAERADQRFRRWIAEADVMPAGAAAAAALP